MHRADVIHFEIGHFDFDTPKYIKQAACKALAEGKAHYTSHFGLLELRDGLYGSRSGFGGQGERKVFE